MNILEDIIFKSSDSSGGPIPPTPKPKSPTPAPSPAAPTPNPAAPTPAPSPAAPTPPPKPTPSPKSPTPSPKSPTPAPSPAAPTPPPKPTPPTPSAPFIFGGWLNCTENCASSTIAPPGGTPAPCSNCSAPCPDGGPPNPSTWGPSFLSSWPGINTVAPGKFGADKVAPYDKSGSYKHKWITVGGAGTNSSNWSDTVLQDVKAAGANGIAFDIEGLSLASAIDWIGKNKNLGLTYVVVPQAGAEGDVGAAGGSKLGFDFVAPMLYYSNGDSYPNMDITAGSGNSADCLNKLINIAGWPPSKIILAYQSYDAARTKSTKLLQLFGYLMQKNSLYTVKYWGGTCAADSKSGCVRLKGPFAGVLGWPAQCGGACKPCWPEIDKANSSIIWKSYLDKGQQPEDFIDITEDYTSEPKQTCLDDCNKSYTNKNCANICAHVKSKCNGSINNCSDLENEYSSLYTKFCKTITAPSLWQQEYKTCKFIE